MWPSTGLCPANSWATYRSDCELALRPLQGTRVKKGQALAYIEQLGTYVPVEVYFFVAYERMAGCISTIRLV